EANKELAIDTSGAQAQLDELLAKAAALRSAAASPRYPGTPGDPNSVAEAAAGAVQRAGASVTPVSISDYTVPSTGKTKSGRNRKTADDRLANDLQAVRDRTAALFEEQAAMRL